ncbi:hypothetical protein C4K02_0219 [Pseudomonas synxantha]|nr:hypothetical protein C4K02_0219 [Pseudomonas synxantha]
MARELAPAGVRSAPKTGTHGTSWLPDFGVASQPSGSKLPRHDKPRAQ